MEDSLDKLASNMNTRSMAQRTQKQEIYTTSKKTWSHFALLLILSLKAHLYTASDTMYRGQPLAWNQTLTSKSGIFELGFFTPEKGIPFCKCTNSGMPNYTVAVLLDNGNFILRDKLDNVLWQSFEEQTNTLLPGAKIGYNRLTNKSNIISHGQVQKIQKLHDIVRLMVFVAIMASVLSIRHLFVIAQKDLNQGGQEIGACKTTQEGALGELL
nr:receptor-like serine/threonine-protein kinase sd1-8 [Quercus suber]